MDGEEIVGAGDKVVVVMVLNGDRVDYVKERAGISLIGAPLK